MGFAEMPRTSNDELNPCHVHDPAIKLNLMTADLDVAGNICPYPRSRVHDYTVQGEETAAVDSIHLQGSITSCGLQQKDLEL